MAVHQLGRLCLLPLLLAACEGRSTREGPAPEPSPPRPEAPPPCGDGVYGVEAYDALTTARFSGRALLFADADGALAEAERARGLLEAALDVDPSALPPAARVALQNDAWGLWQRLEPRDASSAPRRALRDAVGRLVRRLALPAAQIPVAEPIVPPAARAVLPASEGWREVGTEMPVLSHESAFGLRRLFHHVHREGRVAMTSQLVALDEHGDAHATEIAGDLEVLVQDGDEPTARLFELDRRALRCEGPRAALVEVDEVGHVPGLGANRFFLELEPEEPIADFPCARCHDEGFGMALTDPNIEVAPRLRSVLDQARARARPLFE